MVAPPPNTPIQFIYCLRKWKNEKRLTLSNSYRGLYFILIPMLFLRNIDKRYGRRKILENISIDLRLDRTTALVGSNGIGKTTLLKIIIAWKNQTRARLSLIIRMSKGI